MAAPSRVAQSSFGIDVRFTGTRISNRYSLNRSLNDTHDHRLTLDSPPNSGVARLACFIDSRAKNLRRCVGLPPYTPASLSVVYSRIFRRASGGSSDDNNMRLMTAARIDLSPCGWLSEWSRWCFERAQAPRTVGRGSQTPRL